MELNLKQKIIIIIVVITVIAVGSIYTITNNKQNEYTMQEFLSEEAIENSDENNIKTNEEHINNTVIANALNEETIVVHITGQIKKEGIVELPKNARIADAIQAAGGVTSQANLNEVNLAFVLSDGQKIYIPSKNENNETNQNTYITTESGNNVIIQDNIQSQKNQKININKATQEMLENLPGIGPSIAKKIIEHRNLNGKFENIEQLKEVSGIGEAKFLKIKDYIVVE